jgi:pyruvate ferredoxin oxidoreductase delta subunit
VSENKGVNTLAKVDAIIGWRNLEIGCAITEPGSSRKLRTGDWRSQRPVTDRKKCIKCGMCWIFCPDIVYSPLRSGYYEWDGEYCKGCGICAHECPKDAITMVTEGD